MSNNTDRLETAIACVRKVLNTKIPATSKNELSYIEYKLQTEKYRLEQFEKEEAKNASM